MNEAIQRTESDNELAAILGTDREEGITRVDASAVAVVARSAIEAQLDAAHKYPRELKHWLKDAMGQATLTRAVAESCIYTLPRAGKPITGPSIRLAEIMASAYGNLQCATRVIGAEEKEVVAEGIVWDMEKNLKISVEARRRITGKNGNRFNDDMIGVTGAAAMSIAYRNAVFRVVPRAYVDVVYTKVREVAVGTAQTLVARRVEVVERLQKIGVPIERIFPAVGKGAIEDVGLEELEILIGMGTAIKNGAQNIDDCFPPIDSAPGKAAAVMQALAPKPPSKPAEKPQGKPAAKAKAAAAPDPVAATAPTEAPPPDEMDPEPEESKAAGREPGEG